MLMKRAIPSLPRAFMLLALGLWLTTRPALGASDDEAWIERYMRSQASLGADAARKARTLEFGALKEMVGKPVRLFLLGGRQRRGVVERATDAQVWLTSNGKGGYFSYDVKRTDVVRVEQERGQ